MGIFKKLSEMFSSSGRNEGVSYWYSVKCNRCGEQIRARVDLRNDLSVFYGDEEEAGASAPQGYYCRKVIIGENLCFQKIEVELTFDNNRKVIDRKISGGVFVDE
jgi:hypothetical protein